MPVHQHSDAEFAKLQKQWYAKLAKSGFDDIEWVDHETGKGHNSAFLKGSLISGKTYHPGRALYYQLAENYYLHCKNLRGYSRFIWKWHCKGFIYSEILKKVKKDYRNAPSLYTLYYQIKKLETLCYKWNAVHREGIFVKRKEDREALELSGLAEFYAEEYNWLINKAYAQQVGEKKRGRRL